MAPSTSPRASRLSRFMPTTEALALPCAAGQRSLRPILEPGAFPLFWRSTLPASRSLPILPETMKKPSPTEPVSPLTPAEIERAAPEAVPIALLSDLEALLAERYGGALEEGQHIGIEARTGPDAAWLKTRVGSSERAHEIELFTCDVQGDGLDGALGLLVDFLDGVLEELFAAGGDAYLPLDFTPRRFEGTVLYARSELRDYAAEAAAAALIEGRTVQGPDEAQ